jgi:hypothetical protein
METTTQSLAFDELNAYGKANAMSRYNDAPDDWADEIVARAKQDGPERGFEIEEVAWSGFSSQGDGASWTGMVRLPRFIEYHNKPDNHDYTQYFVLNELIKDGWTDTNLGVSRNGFYYNHSGMMRVEDISDNFYNADGASIEAGILQGASVHELMRSISVDTRMDELHRWVVSEARNYANEIYSQLRDEYDEYASEERFKEVCDINGWRFDVNGYLQEE